MLVDGGSLPVDEDVEAEAGQDRVLELGVVVHDDRHDADIGEEAAGTADHVLKSEWRWCRG